MPSPRLDASDDVTPTAPRAASADPSPPVTARQPPGSWTVTIVLAAAAALNYADRTALSTVLAPIRTDLGLTDFQLGVIGSIFLCAYAVASPISGILADRFSRTKLLVLSLLLWSVVTGLTGMAAGLLSFCALRIALGLFESLFHPCAFALVADYHGQATRARAMSLLSLGFQSGIVLGGSIAGYLAQIYSWRVSFCALGAMGLVLTVFWRRFLRDAQPPQTKRAASRPALEAIRYLVRVPTFYIILGKAMLVGSTTFLFLAWLPLYILETFHMKLGEAGFAGTFMLQAAKLIGIAGGGWLSDLFAKKSGRKRALLQSFCYLTAAPFLLVFLSPQPFFVVAAAVSVFSFFNGVGLSSEQPVVCEVVPACYRSTAIGIYNLFATSAGGLGVLVAGAAKSRWGLHSVFGASSVSYALAGSLLMLAYLAFMKRDTRVALEHERPAEA